MKKLRIGFYIKDSDINKSVVNLIEDIADATNFDPPVIIKGINSKEMSFLHKIWHKFKPFFINNVLSIIIKKIEINNVKKIFPNYFASIDLNYLDKFELLEVTQPHCLEKNSLIEFNDDALSIIAHQKLDCIVQFGSELFKGDVLNILSHGLISLQFGNNNDRYDQIGLWEVLKAEPSSNFMIIKQDNEQNIIKVLQKGSLMTSNVWHTNKAQLIEKAYFFLRQSLFNLGENNNFSKPIEIMQNEEILYKTTPFFIYIKYMLNVIFPKLLRKIQSIFLSGKVIRYSIAYSFHNNHSKSLNEYIEIPNPKGRFLADPFVFENNGCNYIFVEDYFYKDEKGRISVLKVEGDKYKFLGLVLEESFHLSFPFIFKDGDEIFMVPESHENLDIRLYKCADFPHKWELDTILMSNVSAADTMIIKKNNISIFISTSMIFIILQFIHFFIQLFTLFI